MPALRAAHCSASDGKASTSAVIISAGRSPARLVARSGDTTTVGFWPCSNIEANMSRAGLEEIGRRRGCPLRTHRVIFLVRSKREVITCMEVQCKMAVMPEWKGNLHDVSAPVPLQASVSMHGNHARVHCYRKSTGHLEVLLPEHCRSALLSHLSSLNSAYIGVLSSAKTSAGHTSTCTQAHAMVSCHLA